jgi:hypothetical protein
VAGKAKPATVLVRLRCILSGFEGNPGPGSVVALEPDEAARLISLGVAENVDA